MSIASEITRIKGNIANAYTTVGNKGGTLPVTQNSANLATAINSIPVGGGESVEENDVNFYDYNGVRTNSYTKNEFVNLTAFPSNPIHDGLTAQGWNWTLSEAKDYVSVYGKLDIGQMYITDDGKTRIYITLEEGRLEPYLGVALVGRVTVDWGDGNTELVTGSGTNVVVYTKHIYSNPGNYVIKLSSSRNVYLMGDSSNGSLILSKNSATSSENRVYQSCIKKIEIGDKILISTYAFSYCTNLKLMTIPNTTLALNLNQYAFSNCYSLQCIIIPQNFGGVNPGAFINCYSLEKIVTQKRQAYNSSTFSDECFKQCYALKSITIQPISLLASRLFENCYSLTSIIIPQEVSTINAQCFSGCSGMSFYDFSNHTSVPTLSNTDAFTNIPSDCKIVVPDALYDTWIAATNWSTYANYIIKKTDWEAL